MVRSSPRIFDVIVIVSPIVMGSPGKVAKTRDCGRENALNAAFSHTLEGLFYLHGYGSR